jgi:hypothetical protein
MCSRLFFVALGVAIATQFSGSTASAQGPARYYPPAGPTLPAQLNYFRRDVGILDQYNAFVQPRQQIDYQFQQLAAQQQSNFRSTQRQLEQLQQIRASEASPTGVGASFQNYMHYYRLPAGRGARAR